MVDDNKIEEAANLHRFELIASMHGSTLGTPMQCFEEVVDAETDLIENSFITGAKWAINELLKDLLHPASEVPRNDNGKILAFSKVNSNVKLYDMNAMLDETACDTYQEMWKIRVRAYTFTDWVFVDELLDLITKGGNHD
jgi:hypothetical protein